MAYTAEQTKYLKKLIDESAKAAKKVDKAKEVLESAESEHNDVSNKLTEAVAAIKLGTFVMPGEQQDPDGEQVEFEFEFNEETA